MASGRLFRDYVSARGAVETEPNLARQDTNLVQQVIQDNYDTIVPLLIEVASRSGGEDNAAFISVSDTTGAVRPPSDDADLEAMNEAFLARSRSGALPTDVRQLDEVQIIQGLRDKKLRIDRTWLSRVKAGARQVKKLLQENIGEQDASLSDWIAALSKTEDLRFDFATVVAANHNYEISKGTRVSNTRFEQNGAEEWLVEALKAMREYKDELAEELQRVGRSFRVRIR